MRTTYPHPPINTLIIIGNESSFISTIFEELKNSFRDYNWYTISVDLTNINEDLIRINDFIKTQDIRYVIANGKEAIFALAITNSLAKIVINPCLYPHTEMYNISETNVNNLKSIEDSTYSNVDGEMRCCTYGVFVEKDLPSFNFDKFKSIYGNSNHTFIETTTKETMLEAILNGLRNSLAYFQKLANQLSELNNYIY